MKNVLVIVTMMSVLTADGQVIGSELPNPISRQQNYLFYFHGQVVTELGDMCINNGAPEWGRYEYSYILDSLRKRGFNVISEIRKKGVDDSVYIQQTVRQVRNLLSAGVNPRQIMLIGASSGWNIVLRAASLLQQRALNYVIMGGCWPDTYQEYASLKLKGNFLSIIEATDPHGTCVKIFEGKQDHKSYQEIKLNTGLSHGFFYRGRREWIDPIVIWFEKK